MADGCGEGSQDEVQIILVLDVIVSYIGMTKSVDGEIMDQADFFADFPVALAGTATDATAESQYRTRY